MTKTRRKAGFFAGGLSLRWRLRALPPLSCGEMVGVRGGCSRDRLFAVTPANAGAQCFSRDLMLPLWERLQSRCSAVGLVVWFASELRSLRAFRPPAEGESLFSCVATAKRKAALCRFPLRGLSTSPPHRGPVRAARVLRALFRKAKSRIKSRAEPRPKPKPKPKHRDRCAPTPDTPPLSSPSS